MFNNSNMDLYNLTIGILNIYKNANNLSTIKEININTFLDKFNPFNLNHINSNYLFQVGGEDDGGDGEVNKISLKYIIKLITKIFFWLLFFLFFGPMAPWVLLAYYTFKRLILGYKIYFRQY